MSRDIRVLWRGDPVQAPTSTEVEHVLENYCAQIGVVGWLRDRWYINFPGSPSFAMARIKWMSETLKLARAEAAFEPDGSPRPRWIEVFNHGTSLNFITRDQDEITNAIALGLAEVFATYWKGTLER